MVQGIVFSDKAAQPIPARFFTLDKNHRRNSYLGEQETNYHCMDNTDLSKELTEDMARESLIAISYKVPDNDTNLTAEKSPKYKYANGGMAIDRDEKYRSELISISYSTSPDVGVLPPLLPVNLDA